MTLEAKPKPHTASEEGFASYCAANGLRVVAFEPDLSAQGISTRPDFLVERNGVGAYCEVKEFTTTPADRKRTVGRPFTMGEADGLRPVRSAVREAARNLKPLAGSRSPLVIILANPRGLHVPLKPERLVHALYGDQTITFLVGPEGGAITEPEWVAGRNGRLRNDHAYVSAVAALHEGDLERDWWREWEKRQDWEPLLPIDEGFQARWHARNAARERAAREEEIPTGIYYRLDVILNPSSDAAPLPRDYFSGERDTLWAFDGKRCFERVR